MALGKLAVAVAALAALVIVALATGAGDARSDAQPQGLYLVPRAAAAAAFADDRVRVIAAYPGFVLTSAPPDAGADLRSDGAVRRDDMRRVGLQQRSVDPAIETRASPPGSTGATELLVVQFAGPIKAAWLDALSATGVRVVTYLAQNGYIVHATSAQRAALERYAAGAGPNVVRGLFALQAADKVAGGVPASGPVDVQVQTLSGAEGAAARERALAASQRTLGAPVTGVAGLVTLQLTLDRAVVDELAADPGVVSVESAAGRPATEDEAQDQDVAANLSAAGTGPSAPGYLAWLNARMPSAPNPFPFVVDISDGGLDDGQTTGPTVHPDLFVNGNPSGVSRVAYQKSYFGAGNDSTGRDCEGHGSINAGIVAGYNDTQGNSTYEDASGYQYGLGVAPFAKVGVSKWISSCGGSSLVGGFTYTGLATFAYTNGARIQNNSWGLFGSGVDLSAYTVLSQEFDAIARDADPGTAGNQGFVEVKSAGNQGPGTGTITEPGVGKNMIAVGRTLQSIKTIGSGSSRGPTDDGRIKPDLIAPGTNITGGKSQTTTGYTGTGTSGGAINSLYAKSTGTSHSAPAVSGAAALVRQYFSSLAAGSFTPSPAFTKALLVNSARDDGIGGSAPNKDQGFGFLNLDEALRSANRFFADQQTTFTDTGNVYTRDLTVASASAPVKVTMAFTDFPGATTGNPTGNDLDLEVDAGGQTYRGNAFASGVSVAGGAADPKNTVEKVVLPAGTSGTVTVRVKATNIAGNGVPNVNSDPTDQDFALAASNLVTSPIAITPPALANGQVGTAYSAPLSASGGAGGAPYTFALASGALPAGLTLSGATISGTPTTAGTSSFRVVATDASGQTGETTYSLVVAPAPPPPIQPPLVKPPVVAPAVSAMKLSSARFRVASPATSLGPVATTAATKRKLAPRGTKLSFRLSAAGFVLLRIDRLSTGRRSGSRCVAATRANRKKPKCTRVTKAGQLIRIGRAGANSVTFSGRLKRVALPLGSYRFAVYGQAGTVKSTERRISFAVVAR